VSISTAKTNCNGNEKQLQKANIKIAMTISITMAVKKQISQKTIKISMQWQ
jgi:hypothetical protein